MILPFKAGDRIRVTAPIEMLCYDEDEDEGEYLETLGPGEEGLVHSIEWNLDGHSHGTWTADVEWDSGWYLLAQKDEDKVQRID
jgi:hypothetical protein